MMGFGEKNSQKKSLLAEYCQIYFWDLKTTGKLTSLEAQVPLKDIKLIGSLSEMGERKEDKTRPLFLIVQIPHWESESHVTLKYTVFIGA